jgi:hypothetical protein
LHLKRLTARNLSLCSTKNKQKNQMSKTNEPGTGDRPASPSQSSKKRGAATQPDVDPTPTKRTRTATVIVQPNTSSVREDTTPHIPIPVQIVFQLQNPEDVRMVLEHVHQFYQHHSATGGSTNPPSSADADSTNLNPSSLPSSSTDGLTSSTPLDAKQSRKRKEPISGASANEEGDDNDNSASLWRSKQVFKNYEAFLSHRKKQSKGSANVDEDHSPEIIERWCDTAKQYPSPSSIDFVPPSVGNVFMITMRNKEKERLDNNRVAAFVVERILTHCTYVLRIITGKQGTLGDLRMWLLWDSQHNKWQVNKY